MNSRTRRRAPSQADRCREQQRLVTKHDPTTTASQRCHLALLTTKTRMFQKGSQGKGGGYMKARVGAAGFQMEEGGVDEPPGWTSPKKGLN